MTVLGAIAPPRFPIGHSDYAELRRSGLTYVDKTLWIAEVLDNPAKVLLVPRPRRFGKTLNMTTLRYFVERADEDRSDLFTDTAVWALDEGRIRAHYQRYPVVYLSFKDVKDPTWEEAGRHIARLLSRSLRDLERLGHLRLEDSGDIGRVKDLTNGSSPIDLFTDMLLDVSAWCHQATGEQVVILIDEYDAPLHAAWQFGYWDRAVAFFRGFLSGGLKDNPYLYKGVLTGILKVAKEGIFSGLNHVETASILGDRLTSGFGFSESEVAELADVAGRDADLPTIQRWYNGYSFGSTVRCTVYNPWSVLMYLKQPGAGPQAFWKNTSDNALIRELLARNAGTLGPQIETLLQGGTIARPIDENVALPNLANDVDAVFGLLTFSGYLTTESAKPTAHGFDCVLRIPNHEVRAVFESSFADWMRNAGALVGAGALGELTRAMLGGDAATFEEVLEGLLVRMLSYHDVVGDPVEAVYQAFLLGLLVHLDSTHQVRSNRESGLGRADVLVLPRVPGPGVVLELARITARDTAQTALQRAAAQLVDRAYGTEVREAGATVVHQYAVVFDGKRCWVQAVPA